MVYIIICFLLIILLMKRVFSHRRFFMNTTNSYSWFEILLPFNPAPKNIYNSLSPENKGAFWSIFSSVIIGILSCWLGFSVQFFVYNSTQTETTKLAHYQVVDKIRPMFVELYDSCTCDVLEACYKLLLNEKETTDDYLSIIGNISPDKINTEKERFLYFLSNERNWDKIIYTTKKCIEISSSIAPYVDYKTSENLLLNNAKMCIGNHLLESFNDTIILDSLSFVNKHKDEYIKLVVKGSVSPNKNLKEIYGEGYTLYRTYLEMRSQGLHDQEKSSLMLHFLTFSLIPMCENIKHITEEISLNESTISPIWLSIIVLLFCVFIGYMLFRIILMRFFDKKSLEPNPRISQSDLDNLYKELEICKKKNEQLEVDLYTESMKIKKLQKELTNATLNCNKDKEFNQDGQE